MDDEIKQVLSLLNKLGEISPFRRVSCPKHILEAMSTSETQMTEFAVTITKEAADPTDEEWVALIKQLDPVSVLSKESNPPNTGVIKSTLLKPSEWNC